MGEPFVGEIRMFGGNFAPNGWMLCQGQTLPISENEVLWTLIGTTYGGDGTSTFKLPNLQGRLPVHQGTGSGLSPYVIGQTGGAETVTLTVQQIPSHTHAPMANNAGGTLAGPGNAIFANCNSTNVNPYFTPFDSNQAQVQLNDGTIAPDGGSQPHENIQPTLCINYIISLFGIFPSRP